MLLVNYMPFKFLLTACYDTIRGFCAKNELLFSLLIKINLEFFKYAKLEPVFVVILASNWKHFIAFYLRPVHVSSIMHSIFLFDFILTICGLISGDPQEECARCGKMYLSGGPAGLCPSCRGQNNPPPPGDSAEDSCGTHTEDSNGTPE